jgi:TfuA protein
VAQPLRAGTPGPATGGVSTKHVKPACIFAGPSLAGNALPHDVESFPPARRGALLGAVRSGYRRIGLIDGAVEESERLSVSELRDALAFPGVRLLGAASMGAVWAAQLESEGMRGVGRVFRLFRWGGVAENDELYVLHAPEALRYRCLTLPLVNIRYTLRAMRLAGHVVRAEEQALTAYMRDVPWFDRDRHSVAAAVYAACGSSRCTGIMKSFDLLYRDIKYEDAMSLISRLRSRDTPIES